MFPKERLAAEIQSYGSPDFTRDGRAARGARGAAASRLHDDQLRRLHGRGALKLAGKEPQSRALPLEPKPGAARSNRRVLDAGLLPTPANPVVYHLTATSSVPESIVLTEDDYLDFLVAVAGEPKLLPHQIKRALAGASLLFVGYRLADWNFRVIHRGLVMAGEQSLRRLSVTVQLRPNDPEREYLEKYFGAMNVRVYWGNARSSPTSLRRRWREFADG